MTNTLILIDNFVQCFEQRKFRSQQGYTLAFAFCAASFIQRLTRSNWIFKLQQVGIRLRASTSTMIFNKGLKLSLHSKQGDGSGDFVNLVVVDVDRINSFVVYIHDSWLIILQIVLGLVLLYKNLGPASFVGLAATIFVMLSNSFFSTRHERFQGNLMEAKDNRMKVTMETLRNMRILKLQGWEMSFLSKILDELDSSLIHKLPYGSSDNAIEITDGNFTWSPTFSPTTPTLRNINLKIPVGTKIAIVGTVASGKSSLVSCILGEMAKISENVMVCGTKAYVAQTPWIMSGTIQENILFGKDMNSELYDKVIEACCLKEDLKILSFGDQTIIGERGINLSGGQKQRIQIARAVYNDTDICLFDDPFSALDAHTASHIFSEVLLGLLKGKTVVFVTHQTEFLNAADLIIVMKDGMIGQVGNYHVLKELFSSKREAQLTLNSNMAKPSPNVENNDSETINLIFHKESKPDEDHSPEQAHLIKEEERERGSVGYNVYWEYLTTSYGGAFVLLVLLGDIIIKVLHIGSYYWLAWATPVSKDVTPRIDRSTLISVYASLALGLSICILVVDLLVVTSAYTTASVLFRKMLNCIFRAPMSFFDATPSGRILSRCATDQSAVETRVPSMVEGVASSVINVLGIIFVMATVAWPVLIIFIPTVFVCIWYQRYYMQTARELSRLSGICEAPVTQHFVETISGTTTIRCFDKQAGFRDAYMKILDAYARPDFHSAAAMKWLLFRQNVFASITFAFILVLLVSFGENVNPGIAGLGVSYGLTLSNALASIVWHLCHCGTKMISVERILQYTSIPSEAPLIVEENRPAFSWPSHGEILITNLQVRYAPHLPLVVQVMFEGTIRSNLDPLEEYTDEQLWKALDKCQLGDKSGRWKESWTLTVCLLLFTENGENWSMGQRQLVCLGRVLLKKCKVLHLDEATASVNTETDGLIQKRLKESFSDCTIITVAHRMTSVLNSDMVLLLDNGQIEEFDLPSRLLENKSSKFAKLVAAWSSLME